jgi:glycosyltransferase involved in cell wall biosynthesis
MEKQPSFIKVNTDLSWNESIVKLPDRMSDGSLWPKLSVITPSYNQGQFLEETILSVISQGYPNLEFIIIDGGSTDNSIQIIKKYEPWISYWVSESDRGQGHALNKGITKATGEFLFWLNSDDICLPGSIQKTMETFQQSREAKLVIGQAYIINEHNEIIGELRSRYSSWEDLVIDPRNSIRQVSSFFSRSLFSELGMINENLHIAMDTDLLVRFTQFNKPIIIEDYIAAYRTHSEAKTYTQILKGYAETDRVREKFLIDKILLKKYQFRSAKNWLRIARSNEYSLMNRVKCLVRSIIIKPNITLSRIFWLSIFDILKASLKRLLRYSRKPMGEIPRKQNEGQ